MTDVQLRSDAERNREAVIAAAIRVLARSPEASMQEIAAAARVGRSTVYRHFPTREALLAALFALVVDEARAVVTAAIAAERSVPEALRRMGREIVGLGERYRFLDRHRELVEEDPFQRPAPDEPLLAWLTAEHARGSLRPELPPGWVYAMIHALAVAADEQVRRGDQDPREAGRLLGETFVHAFAPGV